METKRFFLLCLFCILFTALHSQKPTITYDYKTFRIDHVPELKNANNSKAKWGLFFWEFGDGHYKITEKPKVNYSGYDESGTREVKVQMVPFYTVVAQPITIVTQVQVRKGSSKADYQMDKQLVHLETSANKEVIPGHEIRVALHYKAPNTRSLRDGYILLFFNNSKEKKQQLRIKFNPFASTGSYDLHHQEELDKFGLLPFTGASLQSYNKLKNEYDDVLAFKTSQMEAGEDRRLFLSLQSDKRLKNKTGKKKANKKNQKLTFKALWVPGSGEFDAGTQVAKYEMDILQVHDPNKMEVTPRVAYYRKGQTQTFHYKVDFQNEEKGITRDAKITVFLGDGLDKSTLKILNIGGAINNKQKKWKFNCSEAQKGQEQCFEVDADAHPDSLFFYFYNIDLLGPSFFNRRRSKASVEFSIETTKNRVAETKSRVGISLDEEKNEITNWAKTSWREKGLFIKAGGKLNAKMAPYQNANENIPDRLALGLWYQNAPVGNGLSWGFALDYSAFRVSRDSQIQVSAELLPPEGGLLTQSENIKLNLAEAQLHLGYQRGGIFKVYATSGLSIPVESKFNLGANVQFDLSSFEDEVDGAFGLFGQSADSKIFNKTFTTRAFIGYVGSIGVELGSLNRFTLGLKSEYRYYPTFYYTNHDCFKMTNLEAYIRFKLFTL